MSGFDADFARSIESSDHYDRQVEWDAQERAERLRLAAEQSVMSELTALTAAL